MDNKQNKEDDGIDYSYKGEEDSLQLWKDMFNAGDKKLPSVVYETTLSLMCYLFKLRGIASRPLSDTLKRSHFYAQKQINKGRAIFWNNHFLFGFIRTELEKLEPSKLKKQMPDSIQDVYEWTELIEEQRAKMKGKTTKKEVEECK